MKLDRKQSILQDEATYMAHLASCAAIRAKLQEAQAAAAHHKRRLLRYHLLLPHCIVSSCSQKTVTIL